MPPISSVVAVTITRLTSTVSRQGFGTALIAADLGTAWDTEYGSDRVREYSSLAEMVDDGATTSEAAYVAASDLFAQTPRPRTVKIGRRLTPVAQVADITVTTATNDATYYVTVNGEEAEYLADSSTSPTEIRDGLKSAVDALGEPVTTSNVSTDGLKITASVAGVPFTVAVDDSGDGDKLTLVATTASVGIADDLAAIAVEDDDWYCLLSTQRSDAVSKLAADWVLSHDTRKIAILCSNDANMKLSGITDDLASVLQDESNHRAAVVYHSTVADYPDAAWAGRCLPEDPGSITWKFKTASGITATTLTSAQITALDDKAANHYTTVGGVDMFREGTVASGEFIDIIRGIDWLEAQLGEEVFDLLANTKKVPFTDAGIAMVEGRVRAVLQRAEQRGVIAAGWTTSVPTAASVSSADKAERHLPDVTFIATAAGAVHTVQITGTVAV